MGGVPAKCIKKRFSEEQISALIELKWWDMDITRLNGIEFSNIELAIKQLKDVQDSIL